MSEFKSNETKIKPKDDNRRDWPIISQKTATRFILLAVSVGLVIGTYINWYEESTSKVPQIVRAKLLKTSKYEYTEETNGPVHHGNALQYLRDLFGAKNDAESPVKKLRLRSNQPLHHDDDTAARQLSARVRVLVWVMTSPSNLAIKAKAVKNTWIKRADVSIFFSSKTNKEFPTIGLNVSEGREHLTGKTMEGFKYVYEHHLNDADWFMKADDDTYVIMENLKYFLSDKNTSEPVYYGHHFKSIVAQGYYSGGGGYVLSREALVRLNTRGRDPRLCQRDGGAEDVAMGQCMERLGVRTANSTDTHGRSRFHCFPPGTFIRGDYPNWFFNSDADGPKKGLHAMSDYAVSFHYVSPQYMLELEWFIYHLRPYGITKGLKDLNGKNNNRLLNRTLQDMINEQKKAYEAELRKKKALTAKRP